MRAAPRMSRWMDAEAPTLPLSRLAQRAERGADLFRKELRLLPCGEVAAPLGLVEVDEVGVGPLDPAARRPEDLAGERGEADRERDLRRSLTGRTRFRLSLSELPVPP